MHPARCSAERSQRPSEAELVAVGIGQVEEPLTPFGIARRGVRVATGRYQAGIQPVDVGNVEDQAPPPGPLAFGRLKDQVEKIRPGAKTGELRLFTAIEHLKSQHAVKPDGSAHVMCGEGYGADVVDHVRTAARSPWKYGEIWGSMPHRARHLPSPAEGCARGLVDHVKAPRSLLDYPSIDRQG